MIRAVEYVLKGLIALAILAGLVVQAAVLPSLAYQVRWLSDTDPRQFWVPSAVLVGGILILLALQSGALCVWPLLTRVRRGTVFSPSSFRWVTGIVISAFAVAALSLGLGILLLYVGIQTLGTTFGLLAATLGGVGLALMMLLMKALLRQATEQSVELEQMI